MYATDCWHCTTMYFTMTAIGYQIICSRGLLYHTVNNGFRCMHLSSLTQVYPSVCCCDMRGTCECVAYGPEVLAQNF